MNTLKPCPKCGNEEIIQRDQYRDCSSDRSWDQVSSSIECKCGIKFSPYLCGSYNYDQRRINEEKTRVDWDKRTADDWIQKAIPYLKSELWRISDCLAMPTESGLGADFDANIDEELDRKHKELTELLKLVEKE